MTTHNLLASDSDNYFDCNVCWPGNFAELRKPWFRERMNREHEQDLKVVRIAAPEMYYALEAVVVNGHYAECINGQRGGEPDEEQCSYACGKVRVALDKAAGR